MTDKELIKVAKWLNKDGYGIDLKDSFWMEEYEWGEHKTRDIIDIMQRYANEQLRLHGVVVPKGTFCDKNENKLGMCNCCGDNNCHDEFCKG